MSARLDYRLLPSEEAAIALDEATLGLNPPNDSISAAQACRAASSYHGQLYRKRERCLGCCKPQWKSRLFVIVGRFLYRFTSFESARPKGTPLALEGMEVQAVDDEIYPFAFVVSTLSKAMVLAAETTEARAAWLDELRSAKQRAIKEGLGHAVEKKEHVAFNNIGSKLMQRKWAGRKREATTESPTMVEMRSLGPSGVVGGYIDPHY